MITIDPVWLRLNYKTAAGIWTLFLLLSKALQSYFKLQWDFRKTILVHFCDRNIFPDFRIQYSKNMCSSMKFNSLFYATLSCVHFLPLLQLWFVFSYTLWNAFWQPPENVPELVPLSCGLQCRRQQQRNADRNSTLTTKEWFFSTGEKNKTKQKKKKKEQQINGASPVAELKLFISFHFSHPVYFQYTAVFLLTSRTRCCECPAAWSPLGQTAGPLPARQWAALLPEGPTQLWCCCRHHPSPCPARALWAMTRTRSHRTPAACRGRPPSPRRWSLRERRGESWELFSEVRKSTSPWCLDRQTDRAIDRYLPDTKSIQGQYCRYQYQYWYL